MCNDFLPIYRSMSLEYLSPSMIVLVPYKVSRMRCQEPEIMYGCCLKTCSGYITFHIISVLLPLMKLGERYWSDGRGEGEG